MSILLNQGESGSLGQHRHIYVRHEAASPGEVKTSQHLGVELNPRRV